MKKQYATEEAFLALVKAGLWWEDNGNESQNDNEELIKGVDWGEVLQLSEEQSMVGLVTAGFEKLTAYHLPLTEKLTLLGKCQLIEQRNLAMNQFVGELEGKMREAGISVVLLKGQGIAQCYERPLWRSSGDVDFLLDEVNYEKAKSFLLPKASTVEKEFEYNKHQALTIGPYTVELHGRLCYGLSKKMDLLLEEIRKEIFKNNKVRLLKVSNKQISLPNYDCDVIIIFSHFLAHFYKGGLGIRQICDWCRSLWVCRSELDRSKLEYWLKRMNLVSEWKSFGVFAVDYLGLPKKAMPLYDSSLHWKRKALLIKDFVLKSGDLGSNRDIGYFSKYPYLIRKVCSMKRRMVDMVNHVRIFPLDSLRFFLNIMFNGIRSTINRE